MNKNNAEPPTFRRKYKTRIFYNTSLGDKNSKVQVAFPKMEESGNATSSSEAVTRGNSLSSEPLNFEPAPSDVDISNNPGQIEAFGAKSATNNIFGASAIGVSTPSTGGLFGATSKPAETGLFGQSSFTVGTPASTSSGTFGAFGAKSATNNIFGASAIGVSTPSTGGLFGATSKPAETGLFGQSSFTVGTPASTSSGTFGAFGAKSATNNIFGASAIGVSTPSTGGLFGATSKPAETGLFGQSSFTVGTPASTSSGTFGDSNRDVSSLKISEPIATASSSDGTKMSENVCEKLRLLGALYYLKAFAVVAPGFAENKNFTGLLEEVNDYFNNVPGPSFKEETGMVESSKEANK